MEQEKTILFGQKSIFNLDLGKDSMKIDFKQKSNSDINFGGVRVVYEGGGPEKDPTVPQYVKDITEEDIQNWNNKVSPSEVAASIQTDETLSVKNGKLHVNTADYPEEDNTLPITSAAVNASIGNIEALLQTI